MKSENHRKRKVLKHPIYVLELTFGVVSEIYFLGNCYFREIMI